jgi:betaine-aldehyde dehydrogenase
MVSFTGSIAAGEEIATESGRLLRPVSLELGGKDAFVVCNDANLEAAVNGAAWAAFSNCGQVCISAERFFVAESIADEFVSKLRDRAKQLRIGRGMDPSTDIGPMASEEQLEKVELHVEDALQKGARVVVGGARAKVDGFPKGLFYEPTVLRDVDHQMLVMTEETFGPVAPVMTVQDDDEAIRLANECMYGLGASIWTSSMGRACEIANKLRAGIISINDAIVSFPQCPWGGMKKSGIGRELSVEGLREYTVVKHVALEYGNLPSRPWWFPYS